MQHVSDEWSGSAGRPFVVGLQPANARGAGEDFLDAQPASVADPAGWTDQISNFGPGDDF
jgi:hypothetical protein